MTFLQTFIRILEFGLLAAVLIFGVSVVTAGIVYAVVEWDR